MGKAYEREWAIVMGKNYFGKGEYQIGIVQEKTGNVTDYENGCNRQLIEVKIATINGSAKHTQELLDKIDEVVREMRESRR